MINKKYAPILVLLIGIAIISAYAGFQHMTAKDYLIKANAKFSKYSVDLNYSLSDEETLKNESDGYLAPRYITRDDTEGIKIPTDVPTDFTADVLVSFRIYDGRLITSEVKLDGPIQESR